MDALPPRRKVPKFDFQSEFSMSKIIGIFLILIFFWRIRKWFFGNFNFKTTFLLELDPIFDKAAKLGKVTQDTNNQGGLLLVRPFEKVVCQWCCFRDWRLLVGISELSLRVWWWFPWTCINAGEERKQGKNALQIFGM